MVEYHCILCEYTTIYTTSYKKHLKTKKHLAKEKEKETKCHPNVNLCQPNVNLCQPLVDKHHCIYCNKTFNTRQGKSKHQKICKDNPQMSTQNDSKMTHFDSKMTHFDSNAIIKEYKCKFCNNIYSKNCNLRRHEKTCKVKQENEEKYKNNNMQIDILKKENKVLKENKGIVIHQNNNYNTTNYLNINYQNMQTIEDFLENLKNKYKLSLIDRKCLLNTYHECGIDAFAETFSIIMKKNQSEQVEQGVLPTMPIVCTDCNLRSQRIS